MKYPALMHNLTKVSCVKRYCVVLVVPVDCVHDYYCADSSYLSLPHISVRNTFPLLLHVDQCSAEPARHQWTGRHRAANIPLAGEAGTSSATGGLPCSTGWWQRASWCLFPCCFTAVKDLYMCVDFQLLCGLKNSAFGFWRCSWQPDTRSCCC